jgi:uncharacterized lipoprotein YmbA
MRNKLMTTVRFGLILTLILFQAACSLGGPSRPSEFYVLSAEPGTAVAAVGVPDRGFSVGLGPVSLPDMLDRPQIVTRPDTNRINLAEFDRWGGDLNRSLVRVLSQNLMNRLGTDRVFPFPWSSSDRPNFQVVIHFFRFDGELGTAAHIGGVWRLLHGAGGCELAAQRFGIEKQPAGEGYAEFVAAMSQAVAELSQQIADKVAASQTACP